MIKYQCDICGWIYDPEIGDPEARIVQGSKFSDIPDDWVCPVCSASKESFSALD